MGVERIEVVQLPVESLSSARDFYTRLLGSGPTADNEDVEGGAAVFDLPAGGASIHLQRPPAPRQRPDGLVVALRVSPGTDTEALLRDIEAAGTTIAYREPSNPDLLVVGFDDTEGNHLELLIPW